MNQVTRALFGGLLALTASGSAALSGEPLWVLDRVPIQLGAGQRLVLSGSVQVRLEGGEWVMSGHLRADEGVIEIRSAATPRLAADVRVRGVTDISPAQAGVAAEIQGPFPLARLDLRVDLGDRLRVYGSGLDAWLHGQLQLTMDPLEPPQVWGTAQIGCGTWRGFGRDLLIERGSLLFMGDPEDPAIDIVAWRLHQAVEAGVHLRGTAGRPTLLLLSRPEVPEPDKRSWLVLGRPFDTRIRTAVLATSDAGAAEGFEQDGIVTLGRRLTERLFLSYEQSLRGLQNLVRLQYQISEHTSVRLRAGSQTGVDLHWTRRDD